MKIDLQQKKALKKMTQNQRENYIKYVQKQFINFVYTIKGLDKRKNNFDFNIAYPNLIGTLPWCIVHISYLICVVSALGKGNIFKEKILNYAEKINKKAKSETS